MGFGMGDELIQVLPGSIAANGESPKIGGVLGQEGKVLERVVGEFLDEGTGGQGPFAHHPEGVAVGLLARHQAGAYRGSTARFVLYDHRHAEYLLQAGGQGSGGHVRTGPGAISAQNRDGFVRVVLRKNKGGRSREHQQ